ncbi:MAG TPA: electron transfer flavoprotein subunit alpha/FixB family protein, partial [Nitrospinota bacterium]|nr:electron transfer flavoprotein subunit alpha/FixB family protein [Nitrospinota bacterium]
MSIFVFAEQKDEEFKKCVYEAISLGRGFGDKLGMEVTVSAIGNNISNIVQKLKDYGADIINIVDDPSLKNYLPELYTDILVEQIKESGAKIVILGSTSIGLDLASRIGAKLEASVATDCINIELENGQIIAFRSIYVGKAIGKVKFEKEPAILTLRTNVFPIIKKEGKGDTVTKELNKDLSQTKMVIKEIIKSSKGKKDIEEAEVIVSGGRGMKGPERFSILEELATLLGGAVGASRSVVDSGWRGHEDQVGQTGKTVSPTLYIACGISGS